MAKLFKTILVFVLLLFPLGLGIFGLKKFFPDDFKQLQLQGQNYLVQKIPLFSIYFPPEKKPPPPKKLLDDEKPIPEPEELEYFTNNDVYKAICEKESDHFKPADKFIGCNECPKSIAKDIHDYFTLKYYAKGSIIKKNEHEGIFFMKGCFEDEGTIAIIVRKVFEGWEKVSQFKNVSLDSPPLSFEDEDGFLILVGLKSIHNDNVNRDTLLTLNFKNNKLHTKDLFVSQSPHSLQCNDEYLANMDPPQFISKEKFSIKVDVLGWQDHVSTECKITTKNPNIHLKPKVYELNFIKKGDSFTGESSSQKIINEIEKAQE